MSKQRKQSTQNSSGKGGVIFVLLLLFLSGICFFAGSYHIVNTRGGMKIYAKNRFGFSYTFVDMNRMSFVNLRHHKDVVGTMARNGDLQYVPGGQALIAAARAGQSISEAVTRLDNQYQMSSSVKEMGRIGRRKYEVLNEKYDIRGKADKFSNIAKDKAQKFNKWLKKQ